MALIVEDGSVVAGADSWATLADARALAAKYGVTLPADDTEAEVALRNGGAYVNGYEPNMAGVRVSDVQTMCYPRAGVFKFGFQCAEDSIPAEIILAQVFAAAKIAEIGDAWGVDDGKGILSEEVTGVVAVTYSDNGKTGTYYRIERVDALLKPLLGGAGASNFAVVRG